MQRAAVLDPQAELHRAVRGGAAEHVQLGVDAGPLRVLEAVVQPLAAERSKLLVVVLEQPHDGRWPIVAVGHPELVEARSAKGDHGVAAGVQRAGHAVRLVRRLRGVVDLLQHRAGRHQVGQLRRQRVGCDGERRCEHGGHQGGEQKGSAFDHGEQKGAGVFETPA